jgi:CBS domain-containing protein
VVNRWLDLRSFVEEELLRTGQRYFAVEENHQVVGLVTAHEVKGVEPRLWRYTRIDDVMLPLDRLRTITGDATVADALGLMRRADVNQLPVVSDGRMAGTISRSHILRMLRTRAELRGATTDLGAGVTLRRIERGGVR